MHHVALAQALAVVVVANGTPVLTKKLLRDRFVWPLDCGIELPDGQRLFGASKTIRGVVLAVAASSLAAIPAGIGAVLGGQIGACAMLGDLLSSFCKRRLRLPPSSQAVGLDQVPESLLPLLRCAAPLGLGILDIVAGVIAFAVGELLLSRLLFRLNIRDRPY